MPYLLLLALLSPVVAMTLWALYKPITKTPDRTPAPQPATDAEARMRVAQIFGSDLDAPSAYTGDWHQALKTAADRWANTDYKPAA